MISRQSEGGLDTLGLGTCGSGMVGIGALCAFWFRTIRNGRGNSVERALGRIPDTDAA